MIMTQRLFTLLSALLLFVFYGCSNVGDCLTTAGTIIQEELQVDPFDRILVNEDVEMIVSQGDAYKVVVETGENLIGDFSAEVVDGKLILTMGNTCELIRPHNITKVYVTAPELREIVSSTQFRISSVGVLSYERLKISSFTFSDDRWVVNGEFDLNVDVGELNVLGNEMANFEVQGKADVLKVLLKDGSVRLYAPELTVRAAEVIHRSTLNITINPTESVTGELLSTGDLILVNTPPVIDVVQKYKGQVITN